MSKPDSIMIDDSKYIREDLMDSNPDELEGLKYAVVRSRNQGVMSGYVVSINGQAVVLRRARQIWRYDSRFVLTDMAEYGVRDKSACKFSCELSQDTVMLEACGVLYCSKIAGDSIRSVEAQNYDRD
jgi:hypothetical protein